MSRPGSHPTAGGSRGASAAPLSPGPLGRPVCATDVSSLTAPGPRAGGLFPQRRPRLGRSPLKPTPRSRALGRGHPCGSD